MTCKKGHFTSTGHSLPFPCEDLTFQIFYPLLELFLALPEHFPSFTWTFSFSFLEKEPFPDTPIDLSYFSLAFFFFLTFFSVVCLNSFVLLFQTGKEREPLAWGWRKSEEGALERKQREKKLFWERREKRGMKPEDEKSVLGSVKFDGFYWQGEKVR